MKQAMDVKAVFLKGTMTLDIPNVHYIIVQAEASKWQCRKLFDSDKLWALPWEQKAILS